MFYRNFLTKQCYGLFTINRSNPLTAYKYSFRKFTKNTEIVYETLQSTLRRFTYIYEVETKERIHLPSGLENHIIMSMKNCSLKDLNKLQIIHEADMLSLQDLIKSYYNTKDYARMKVMILELNEKYKIINQILTEKDKHYLG